MSHPRLFSQPDQILTEGELCLSQIESQMSLRPSLLNHLSLGTSPSSSILIDNICSEIQSGSLTIPEQRADLTKVMAKKITKEEKQIEEMKAKKALIDSQIRLLDEQSTTVSRRRRTEASPVLVLSRDKHEEILKKFSLEKTQRIQLKKKRELIGELKLNKILEEKEQERAKIKQAEVQLRRLRISEHFKTNRAHHEEVLNQIKEGNKRYKEAKLKLQERSQKHLDLPSISLKSPQHRERGQYQLIIDEIKQHEAKYLSQREELRNSRLEAKRLMTPLSPKMNHSMKSLRLKKILEAQLQEQRIRLQQKREELQKRISKKSDFVVLLKTKFVPRVDEKKRQQIKLRLEAQEAFVRQHTPSDSKHQRQIGLNYLKEAGKKLRRIVRTLPSQNNSPSTTLSMLRNTETLRKPSETMSAMDSKRLAGSYSSKSNHGTSMRPKPPVSHSSASNHVSPASSFRNSKISRLRNSEVSEGANNSPTRSRIKSLLKNPSQANFDQLKFEQERLARQCQRKEQLLRVISRGNKPNRYASGSGSRLASEGYVLDEKKNQLELEFVDVLMENIRAKMGILQMCQSSK